MFEFFLHIYIYTVRYCIETSIISIHHVVPLVILTYLWVALSAVVALVAPSFLFTCLGMAVQMLGTTMLPRFFLTYFVTAVPTLRTIILPRFILTYLGMTVPVLRTALGPLRTSVLVINFGRVSSRQLFSINRL